MVYQMASMSTPRDTGRRVHLTLSPHGLPLVSKGYVQAPSEKAPSLHQHEAFVRPRQPQSVSHAFPNSGAPLRNWPGKYGTKACIAGPPITKRSKLTRARWISPTSAIVRYLPKPRHA